MHVFIVSFQLRPFIRVGLFDGSRDFDFDVEPIFQKKERTRRDVGRVRNRGRNRDLFKRLSYGFQVRKIST